MTELAKTMYQDPAAPALIGEVLAGKYRVDRVLGVGGMGVVVAATHLQLDQLVALKFIRREAMMNAEVVSRFEREARAAVRLKSEHVARIIDVGRLESGAPYIVMEYLEGQDLSGLLQQQGTLGVSVACDFIIQACDAIAEAHGLGIVHRDLKPGNLFLANTSHGQQTIKVLDFGISKSTASDPNMTRTQAVMGSPGYMSPEQMRSTKNVDGRTDVWSLGVILYELVAGRVPFYADTFTALCLKVVMDPYPPLQALPTALPPGFEAVVGRALEKDPALRYQSAVELAQALAPFAGAQSRDRAFRLGAADAAVRASGSYQLAAARSAETTLGAAAGQARTGPVGGGRRHKLIFAGIGLSVMVAISVVVAVARTTTTGVARQPQEPERRDPPGVIAGGQATVTPPDAGVTASVDAPVAVLDGSVDAADPAQEKLDAGSKRKARARPATSFDPYGSPD